MNTNVSNKQINQLAIPAIIAGVSEPILSLTDAAIVGHMPLNATVSLAAVGIVSSFLSMLIWVLGQSRSAISSIISQYLGANKLKEVKSLPAQAISIILILSVFICAATIPFSEAIFKFYNASGLLLDYSVEYYKIRIIGFPFTLYTFAVFGVFRGLQNTYHPMVIAIFGTATNIVLDLVLVYGITNIIDPMNLKGAALASILSQALMAVMATALVLKNTPITLKIKGPINKELPNFLMMIGNLILRTLALNLALYFATSFATGYGTNYIAAYTIAINLWFFAAFAVDGYASAGNIISGKLFGAKQFESLIELSQRLTKKALLVGLLMAGLGGLFYKTVGVMFTSDPKVLDDFYEVFWIVLAMQPLCAITFVFDGIFKGLGKMKALRNVLFAATFLVFIPALLLGHYLDFKLHGILWAFTLWIVARGVPLVVKFKKQFLPLARKH
ncbi:MAG: MATE family efflux transporter [Flavobacteriaceae bacterium]